VASRSMVPAVVKTDGVCEPKVLISSVRIRVVVARDEPEQIALGQPLLDFFGRDLPDVARPIA